MIKDLGEKQHNSNMIIPTDKSIHEMCKLVARRIHRNSILFVDRNNTYAKVMKEHRTDLQIKDINLLSKEKDKAFRYLVLMEVLENYNDSKGLDILQSAWALLMERGRLIVIVPNEDVYEHPHQIRKFKRKSLKKILQPFGKPKIITEQPFQWLMMYVIKRSNKEHGVNKSVEKRLRIMARLCHGKVLELGCGNGTSSAVIRNHGLVVVGVDMNEKKINAAKQNYSDISFIQSDVLNLAFSPETFDTVALPEILEHVSEEAGDRMLKIAWKLLKQSGRLIVSVPNDNCIPHIDHIRQFKKRALHCILQKYGEPKLVIEQPYKWLMMYVDKE